MKLKNESELKTFLPYFLVINECSFDSRTPFKKSLSITSQRKISNIAFGYEAAPPLFPDDKRVLNKFCISFIEIFKEEKDKSAVLAAISQIRAENCGEDDLLADVTLKDLVELWIMVFQPEFLEERTVVEVDCSDSDATLPLKKEIIKNRESTLADVMSIFAKNGVSNISYYSYNPAIAPGPSLNL